MPIPAEAPPEPDADGLLLAELDRLSYRHPGGVERGVLRSSFILAMAGLRERAGLPKLTPAQNVELFDSILNKATWASPRKIVATGDLLRRRGRKATGKTGSGS